MRCSITNHIHFVSCGKMTILTFQLIFQDEGVLFVSSISDGSVNIDAEDFEMLREAFLLAHGIGLMEGDICDIDHSKISSLSKLPIYENESKHSFDVDISETDPHVLIDILADYYNAHPLGYARLSENGVVTIGYLFLFLMNYGM